MSIRVAILIAKWTKKRIVRSKWTAFLKIEITRPRIKRAVKMNRYKRFNDHSKIERFDLQI